MPLITCQNVSFSYDNGHVLKGLQFSVSRGEYLCIVGENGSGKSTLIRGLLGLKPPAAGVISFHEGLNAREIGYLPQQTAVQKDFPASVFEVVCTGRRERNGLADMEKNMDRLGIKHLKKR